MKCYKLLHLLALVALVACMPTLGPAISLLTATPTLAVIATTAAPASASPTTTFGPPGPTSPPTRTATALASPTSTQPKWGHQAKTNGCQAAGALPDPACTPGDIFPNVAKGQVCVSGYSSSVRNVPASEKDAVYAEYGINSHATGQPALGLLVGPVYEIDHFVSLELGGSNDISNLWPEPANPTPGLHQKDQVENYLHGQVCSGAVTLAGAQRAIAVNWLAVYSSMPAGSAPPAASPTRIVITFTPTPVDATATQSSKWRRPKRKL